MNQLLVQYRLNHVHYRTNYLLLVTVLGALTLLTNFAFPHLHTIYRTYFAVQRLPEGGSLRIFNRFCPEQKSNLCLFGELFHWF